MTFLRYLSKHPGSDGSPIHNTGTGQEVHNPHRVIDGWKPEIGLVRFKGDLWTLRGSPEYSPEGKHVVDFARENRLTRMRAGLPDRTWDHPARVSADSELGDAMRMWRSGFSESMSMRRALAGQEVAPAYRGSERFKKNVRLLMEALKGAHRLDIPQYRTAWRKRYRKGDVIDIYAESAATSDKQAIRFFDDSEPVYGGVSGLTPTLFVFDDARGLYHDDDASFPRESIVTGRYVVDDVQDFDSPVGKAQRIHLKWSGDVLSKHPGSDGSPIHDTGTGQEVHGRRHLPPLKPKDVKDTTPITLPDGTPAPLSLDSVTSEAVRRKILDALEHRYTVSNTIESVMENYRRVLDKAVEWYREHPDRQLADRFYRRWFDEVDKMALATGKKPEQWAAAAAIISGNLTAEENLSYIQRLAEVWREDPVLDQATAEAINAYFVEKEKKPVAKPGVRFSEQPVPAAVQMWRHFYNVWAEKNGVHKLGAPNGWREFKNAIRILRDDITIEEGVDTVKYRSFYNNILDPTDLAGHQDVTIDFQMIEAGLGAQRVNYPPEEAKLPASIRSTPTWRGVKLGVLPVIADGVRKLYPEYRDKFTDVRSPAELQEIIWATWKRGKDEGWWGDLPRIKENPDWAGRKKK